MIFESSNVLAFEKNKNKGLSKKTYFDVFGTVIHKTKVTETPLDPDSDPATHRMRIRNPFKKATKPAGSASQFET